MNSLAHAAIARGQPVSAAAANGAHRPSFDRIVFDDVGVRFAMADGRMHEAVRSISFAAANGKITCVIGPSGCGKTTLLNLVAGFVEPAGGRITIEGMLSDVTRLRKSYVFQEYALFPWRTARGNVEFGLQVLGYGRKERHRRALDALRQVGLEKFCDFYPHRLSGGMKQRVAVARALAFEPDVLLMDEPFAALDEDTREGLQNLVVGLWQATRKTIIYVTHSIAEAVFLADRVVALTPGPGEVREIVDINLSRPRDRYGEDFLAYEKQLALLVRPAKANDEGGLASIAAGGSP
jgi:NitT/TauT family transport system ATP-binding protein